MSGSNNVILYVADTQASRNFYVGLLEQDPVQDSPVFVMFGLPSGLGLGLWARDNVQPKPAASSGGSEIGIKVESAAAVDELFAIWRDKGATIALPPTDLGFGRSFVALDPDGHRLRVYARAGA